MSEHRELLIGVYIGIVEETIGNYYIIIEDCLGASGVSEETGVINRG